MRKYLDPLCGDRGSGFFAVSLWASERMQQGSLRMGVNHCSEQNIIISDGLWVHDGPVTDDLMSEIETSAFSAFEQAVFHRWGVQRVLAF